MAYISDTNRILNKDLKLKGLKYLVIDCLKFNSHQSHFNLSDSLKISKKINAKTTVLTNLHSDQINYLKKYYQKILYRLTTIGFEFIN